MQQDPWAEFRTGPATQAAPAPQRAPGIIRGPAPTIDPVEQERLQNERTRIGIAQQSEARAQAEFEAKQADKQQSGDARRERLARISTALDNLRRLEELVSSSNMGTGSIVGQESFRAGEDYLGLSGLVNQRANDVAGSIEMVQGDLINQVRNEMQEQGAPIGVRGADTEKEASRLAASIANLSQTQDEGEFLGGVERAREYYIRRLAANFSAMKEAGEDISETEVLQTLLERGATKKEILQVSAALGLDTDEKALTANIRSRDAGGPVTGFVPPSDGGGSDGGITLSQVGEGIAQGFGNVVQGVGDTIGLITDPIARGLASAFGYDSSQMDSAGTVMRESLGLPQSAPGINRSAQEFAGSALLGGVAARGLSAVASPGTTQNVLSTLGRTPIRDTAAGAGAGAGASIGEDVGGTPGAVLGALAGGLGGYSAANRAARMGAGTTPNALSMASQRQNVDLLPADAGGPVTRAVTTGTRASPLSVGPVTSAAERQQQQFGDAARRVAASQGEVLNTQQAGEAVRRGAENYIEQSRIRGQRLYERAEKQAQGVSKVKAPRTIAAIDEALDRLRQNPAAESGAISRLEAFRAGIENGAPITGLRDARTTLSQGVYDGNMRSGAEQAMWKGILSNVADDIDAGLRSVGREEAANTFRAADKMWAERIDVIDKVLQPIIGREGAKGGEQILQAIESAARGQAGGNARLSRILGAMPKEEAGNVRATIVDRLGRATPGAQDAQGEAFSAASFLTNWNKMTPQAKASLFPDKAIRNDLSDLAKIAEGTKQGRAMANTSNTGVAVNSANVIAGGFGAAKNLPLTLLGAGSLYVTGRLMASPKFARLLARTSKMPPEAANRTFREQLGVLATREPLLRDDIGRLTQAINDNGRLAAEEGEQQQ